MAGKPLARQWSAKLLSILRRCHVFNFSNRKANPSEVTPEDIQRRQAGGERLFFLDVREPAEYAEAHIAGSTLIPLGQLAHRISKLPQDRPIVAVCRSGNRSSVAQTVLTRAGFTNVLNLRGGMLAWGRSGLPTKRGT
jgi:rhodanese-related sulfurtransferase